MWGRIGALLGLKSRVTDAELAEWKELVYDSCTLCGRCSMVCPVGNDIVAMVRKIREGMAAAGHAPRANSCVKTGSYARQSDGGEITDAVGSG
ncbi:MAG: 4Fe-4S binding protein [Thiotrichaceae bacterium]